MLPELKINRERMENAARDPNLFATDLADYLVKKGVPFREAHETVGKLSVHFHNEKRSAGSNWRRGNENVFATLRR
jgi:argininosuccinate lyase